jgi:hypothetical protein
MDLKDKLFLEEFIKGNYYAYLMSFYRDTIKAYRYMETMTKEEATHRITLLNEFWVQLDLETIGSKFTSSPDEAPLFEFDLKKQEAEQFDNVVLFDLKKGNN